MFLDFAEIKATNSIEDVAVMLNLELSGKGQLRGKCPTCGGDKRSLVVTPDKQAAFCFSERKGGDCLWLASHVLDCGVKEAAQFIVENSTGTSDSNGTDTSTSNSTRPKSSPTVPTKTKIIEPLPHLQADHEIVKALGLSVATCEYFQSGYTGTGVLKGRFCIAIHDMEGNLVGYCGRAVREDQHPTLKYYKGFDPAQYVFNLHRVALGELQCVDDPLEALLAYEHGVENVISFLVERQTNVIPLRKRA